MSFSLLNGSFYLSFWHSYINRRGTLMFFHLNAPSHLFLKGDIIMHINPITPTLLIVLLALAGCSDTVAGTLEESAAPSALLLEPVDEHIPDGAAANGRTAELLRTGERARFELDSVQDGAYEVHVRARGDNYEGWPILRLSVNDQQLGETIRVESSRYLEYNFGEFNLSSGQVLEAVFTNDNWDGSKDKDRNLYVDHLTLTPIDAPTSEPAPTPEPPADSPELAPSSLPAFPGAEGFGADTVHGRGGRVIQVTNLDDSGPGSLRAALEAEGPRIVVFRVGGIIELESDIKVRNPYLMVAGQTAPGDGIVLKNAGISVSAHDVVLRHLRGRPGDAKGQDPDDRDSFQIVAGREDGRFIKVYNVVFDHLSASWAIDEVMSTWGKMNEDDLVYDVTIQWSIISEGLDDSLHPEGPHSKGLLIGDGTSRISVHHNLFAHNPDRHPLFKSGTSGQIINNVIYNSPGGTGLSNAERTNKPILIDAISNVYKEGPNSAGNTWAMAIKSSIPTTSKVYAQGNLSPQRPTDEGDEWLGIRTPGGEPGPYRADSPVLGGLSVRATSAQEAYEAVLSGAGATLPARDSVDARVVRDVRNGAGSFIDTPREVGGYPSYASGEAPEDSDGDGMPDAWEQENGFAPGDASDGPEDADGDGYTNVEEFLNRTTP